MWKSVAGAAAVGGLRQQQTDLEAFSHAMTHELRAPPGDRGVCAGAAGDDHKGDQEQHCLHRILAATSQAQGLITSLLAFGRLGYDAVRRQPVSLHDVVEAACVSCKPSSRCGRTGLAFGGTTCWCMPIQGCSNSR